MDPHAQGYGQSPAPQYTPYEKAQPGQAFPANAAPAPAGPPMPQGPYSTQQMGQSHPGSGQPMHTPPPMMQQQSYGVLVGNSQPMQMQPGMSQGGQPQMMHPQMSHQNSNFGVNQGGRQYQNATPLQVLGRGAAPVDCPSCGVRAMTRTNYEVGNTTHAWALGAFCFTLCLCFVPYMMNSTKDVAHHCGNCGVLLATWHKSGSTEVHVHA